MSLGAGGHDGASRWSARALPVLLGLYALGLLVFPPSAILNSDEAQYVRQAQAYAHGKRHISVRDPRTWETRMQLASTYPPGTPLVQAPFVWLGGWSAAAWASFAGLSVVAMVTASWLKDRGLPQTYAALVLVYPPSAVLGRTGMGDLPSAAVVTLALWTLERAGRRASVLGGFAAGASTAFRDSNPVLVAPALVARLIRREPAGLLVAATVGGVGLRAFLAWVLQGTPTLLRGPYPFTLVDSPSRAILYAMAMLLMVPGGLIALVLYRGPRRPELVGTVLLGWLFFSLYSYSGQYSGLFRSLILGPRYLIPIVPVLSVMVADVVERRGLSARWKRALERSLLLVAAAITCAVHPILAVWGHRQAQLVRAVYSSTSPEALVITETGAADKYLNGIYGARTVVDWQSVPPESLGQLLGRGSVQLAFFERDDSPYWRGMKNLNRRYLEGVAARCELTTLLDLETTEHLRVMEVQHCQ